MRRGGNPGDFKVPASQASTGKGQRQIAGDLIDANACFSAVFEDYGEFCYKQMAQMLSIRRRSSGPFRHASQSGFENLSRRISRQCFEKNHAARDLVIGQF